MVDALAHEETGSKSGKECGSETERGSAPGNKDPSPSQRKALRAKWGPGVFHGPGTVAVIPRPPYSGATSTCSVRIDDARDPTAMRSDNALSVSGLTCSDHGIQAPPGTAPYQLENFKSLVFGPSRSGIPSLTYGIPRHCARNVLFFL